MRDVLLDIICYLSTRFYFCEAKHEKCKVYKEYAVNKNLFLLVYGIL